ncbi:MAG: DoxX family protein [Patescibacteria group bacterium]
MGLSALINADLGLFILRLVVAVVFLYHGLPKLMKAKMMGQMMGMPGGAIFVLGIVETLSSLALILGFNMQSASILLGIVMLGAIYFKTAKWQTGFSATDKTGWEFDLILLAANAAIFFTGGGSYQLF